MREEVIPLPSSTSQVIRFSITITLTYELLKRVMLPFIELLKESFIAPLVKGNNGLLYTYFNKLLL